MGESTRSHERASSILGTTSRDGIEHVCRAWVLAQDAERPPPEFGVEIRCLHKLGLTDSDLRWLQQCRRECLRQAALVRATQRAVGLPAAEGTAKPTRKKNSEPARKKRKPTVRALKAAERLRENSSGSKSVVGLEPDNMNSGVASSSLHPKEQNDGHRG